MSKLLKTITLWLWGGFIYYLIETLWRGYSHPSMFVVGGLCFVLLGAINVFLPWTLGLVYQALIGAAIVTAAEFVAGLVVNVWLGWGVWDYSQMPLNVMGQVCLPYFFLWIFAAAFGVWLDDFLRWKLYDERKPRYKLF